MVVFPRVPPFRNVGRERGRGFQKGFQGGVPLGPAGGSRIARGFASGALSRTPFSCSGHSLFFAATAPQIPPGAPIFDEFHLRLAALCHFG
jgi:hypothetical protein